MKRLFVIITIGVSLMAFTCACNKIQYDLYGNLSGSVIDVDSGEPITQATVTLSPGGLNT